MRNQIEHLVDNRNIYLWQQMNKKFNIFILESFEPNYSINIKKKKLFRKTKVFISVLSSDLCPASFTHELLHLYLTSMKILIGDDLIELIFKNENLYRIFSRDLRNHVSNCLEHIKMLPLYSELGYENEKFISDYSTEKMTPKEMNNLEFGFSNIFLLDRGAVDFYIGKFFAMKACNNTTIDYENYYTKMKNLDFKLFNILDEFWLSWINYDITKTKNNYNSLLYKFTTDLNFWINSKAIL
ncbi:hypothetical protein E0I26_16410 [Flavobacterium rhamnosiphilum]|uniref:Uncharacterized protein n=1 Tax=Flavobacterium rhamnosiphilum TaxID=2541724 RepID=A0A4R5F1T6_9FLAO|nr:hypothetical protein [Flavobacterium rhamnosiphilum]TDE41411.1 hypothetical protein E0I26_16410 [Flavobacterium rhamnosiphilum]